MAGRNCFNFSLVSEDRIDTAMASNNIADQIVFQGITGLGRHRFQLFFAVITDAQVFFAYMKLAVVGFLATKVAAGRIVGDWFKHGVTSSRSLLWGDDAADPSSVDD